MNFSMRREEYNDESYGKFKRKFPDPVAGTWAKDTRKKPVPPPQLSKEWWETAAYRVNMNL